MGANGSYAADRGAANRHRARRLQRGHAADLDPVPSAAGCGTGGAGMSDSQEITYTVDFEVRGRGGWKQAAGQGSGQPTGAAIPRIARLMALAIRLDGLIREQALADYAEVARRGRVTRARMTQIMKLLDLAPDIQEQILFLPPLPGLNERNLRPVVKCIDWTEQRRVF